MTRQEQDEFAAASHRKAAAAQEAGRFQQEIVPVRTVVKDAQTGEELGSALGWARSMHGRAALGCTAQ